MLNNGITCCVVFCCFAVAGVCIVDVGVAAIAIDSQRVAVLLEDIACFSIACTTNEACNFTASESVFFPLFITIGVTIFFISPGCTVGQSQINGTTIAICFFFISKVLISNAVPSRIFGSQLEVNNGFFAVAGKSFILSLLAEDACITFKSNSFALVTYINGTQSCTNSMVSIALFITVIHNFDISCTQSYSSTICCYSTGAVSCNGSLAINNYAGTCTVSVDTGNVSPGGFTQSSSVFAIDNIFNSPLVAVLSHGQVSMQLDFGIAVSVNAIYVIIAMSFDNSIAVNSYCSLFTSAVNVDSCYAACADHWVTIAQYTGIGIVNINIQSACSNCCCAACNAVIDAAQRNSVIQNTCIRVRRNSLAVQSYFQLQSLILSLNHQILNVLAILYSCTADDKTGIPVRILFLKGHLVNLNGCIFSKYIGAVVLLYAAICTLFLTADKIGENVLGITLVRTGTILFSSTLTGILIKFNGIRF